MAALGHGVSEAVRNHIPVWVNTQVVTAIGKPAHILRVSKNWKRRARRNSPSGQGFEREYFCEGAGPNVQLIVHSPADDYSADQYVFMVNGKAVAGGKTSLKSVHTTSTVSNDKTSLQAGTKEVAGFNPLSDAELRKIQMNMTYGKSSYAFLELERG